MYLFPQAISVEEVCTNRRSASFPSVEWVNCMSDSLFAHSSKFLVVHQEIVAGRIVGMPTHLRCVHVDDSKLGWMVWHVKSCNYKQSCHSLAVKSHFSQARPNNATVVQYWDDTQLCYCGWLKFCTTCNDTYQLVEDFSHQQLSRIYCPQFRWSSGTVSSMLTSAFPISGVLRL